MDADVVLAVAALLDAQAFEQLAERPGGQHAVDHHAQGAALVVLHHVDDRLAEVRIVELGRGDQQLAGQRRHHPHHRGVAGRSGADAGEHEHRHREHAGPCPPHVPILRHPHTLVARTLAELALLGDPVVGDVDVGKRPVGMRDELRRQALGDQPVGMVLAHQLAIGLADLVVARIA